MRVEQCTPELLHDADNHIRRKPRPGGMDRREPLLEALAVDPLHDDVLEGPIGPKVEEAHNIGMLEAGEGPGFALEPLLE